MGHERTGYQPTFVERHPELKEVVDQGLFPRSIAIIPDNNRSHAEALGLNGWEGHLMGVNNMIELLREYRDSPAEAIILWGASIDNLLKRPDEELGHLKEYIRQGLVQTQDELMLANTKLIHIGRKDPDLLSGGLLETINQVEEATRENTGQRLYLALAYSGEDHHIRATQRLVDYVAGVLRNNPDADVSSMVNEAFLHRFDDGEEAGWQDVDLLIRTRLEEDPEEDEHDLEDDELDDDEQKSSLQKMHLSGIGNIVGSSTLVYTFPVAFPAFKSQHLDEVILDFAKTQRKKGA